MDKILLYKLKFDTLSIECVQVDRFDANDYFIDEPSRKKDWQPQRMKSQEHQMFTSLDAATATARQLAGKRMTELIHAIDHTVGCFPFDDPKLKSVLSILGGQVNKLHELNSQLTQFS